MEGMTPNAKAQVCRPIVIIVIIVIIGAESSSYNPTIVKTLQYPLLSDKTIHLWYRI